ncbi:MAG: aldehyde ferredoxin oxidoreductase family protein [Anaerolineae bacterium]|nr:aldehyde ferredoxin oxidoreductase family protein [Anaerolineae bacterium]
MPYGYHGKILHVDLTVGKVEVEEPEESFYRRYLGGSAMGLTYLLKHTPPGADPLGPQNTLSLMTGVITGAPFSGQSRLCATARSPATGLVGDSQAGGFWPAELKAAGFDGIVVHGQAERPVYLWVHDGEAQLRDAAHLWGRFTADVEDAIRAELGDRRIHVLQCGPAAEQGVRFGALINNANRANGRTGMGTVMAAKKLKAVAVRGHQRPALANPEAVRALARWGAEHFESSDIYGMGLLGTAEVLLPKNKRGGLPTRNWTSGSFEGAEAISGPAMRDTILKGRDTCFGCVVRCKRVVEVSEGPFRVDPRYGGPEYETLATMGSYCGVSDLAAIARANQLCNMYGMDTISCGATVAWAMDCFERGLLTRHDTDGLELRFGNAEALVQMVERIGKREGLGRVLGEGSARAAEALGVGQDLVVAVKNHELPAHMPQVRRSLALIYAVNPFGADHQSHEHDPSYELERDWKYYGERMAELDLRDPQPVGSLGAGKVRYALYTQYFYSCLDSVCACQFVFGPAWHLYGPGQLVEAVRAVTGWNVSLWELMKAGERRLNLLRVFNAREGMGAEADTLPPKLFQPLRGGPTDGIALSVEEAQAARSLYYRMAGWDEEGKPTPAKLEELSLGWAVDEL